jgi:Clp amino terminal domain, pathogenicity island component
MLPFTPRLRSVFAYAEARQLQGVSSLDLLAGIMSLRGGVADSVLKARGFAESPPLDMPSRNLALDNNPVQYRGCALTALSGAMSESVRAAHQLVGVEHMLVGILISPSTDVSSLFAEKGINLAEVLSAVRKNM